MSASSFLSLSGIRENNLKGFDLELPHDQLVVITGVSGSGKSSLAFDTIYSEGGRRYIETFSPYTRQFLDRLHKPEVDAIHGVRPALALEQRNRVTNSRSTVGTSTEINDYLKIIWSHLGVISCNSCGSDVYPQNPKTILADIEEQVRALASTAQPKTIAIGFPVPISRTASLTSLRTTLLSEGFLRFFQPQTSSVKRVEDLKEEDIQAGDRSKELCIVVERFKASKLNSESEKTRLLQSINQAYRFGKDKLNVLYLNTNSVTNIQTFRRGLYCKQCDTFYAQLKPARFTFNSALGACNTCRGFGHTLAIDPNLCVPDPSLSIEDGALACWRGSSAKRELGRLKEYCQDNNISLNSAWHKLSKRNQEIIFNATRKTHGFRGIHSWFELLQKKSYRMHVRVFLSRYRKQVLCPSCKGARIYGEALLYKVNGKTLPEVWQSSISDIAPFFEELAKTHRGEEGIETAVDEALSRIHYLLEVGLDYITLDRQSRTLSGGESQRVNLTTILGSRLVNTMLVLDEPTIGLHARDTARLIGILKSLRDRGNSVFVVEHDIDVIKASDRIIDIGPRSAEAGGEIVFQGALKEMLSCETSLTAKHLREGSENLSSHKSDTINIEDQPRLEIKGAKANNLKNIDLSIPLGCTVALTGVSGSGKSTLARDCLHQSFKRLKEELPLVSHNNETSVRDIEGIEHISDVILIDQTPVGKTPRSNPGTYTKVWDIVRECFAGTTEAQKMGLGKSAFSFNVDGGRCPDCKGAGYHKVEMQFLPDVYTECEECGGSRFKEQVLAIKFAGHNVQEFLNLSLDAVSKLFEELKDEQKYRVVITRIKPLLDLGLGYLRLGQPLNKLSGGEAQRIKLASYLGAQKSKPSLFILDEPTTGLHANDVQSLLNTTTLLCEQGHSLLLVEHHLDVIRNADWIIDLGPEGGESGGTVVAQGTPQDLVRNSVNRSHTAALLAKLPKKHPTAKLKSKATVDKPSNKTTRKPAYSNAIQVIGARHHNLKNISVSIPKDKLVVVTGVSGSGKSSLVFDIIFSEGQRRYIDCLSPYARQFIRQLKQPDVDRVDSLSPTIAISQKTAPPLGVSTIATTTEIYQYLRLLYCKVGTQHCPEHNLPISSLSTEDLAEEILTQFKGRRIEIFAPVISGRKGFHNDVFRRAFNADIQQARVDKKVIAIGPDTRLERHKLHWISLLVGSLSCKQANKSLLSAAIDQALLLGDGVLEIMEKDSKLDPQIFSTARVCPKCKTGFRELDPQDFSFRSKRGVCRKCSGKGFTGERHSANRVVCPECQGARINALGRSVLLGKTGIHQLTTKTPLELRSFLETHQFNKRLKPVVEPILEELNSRLQLLSEIGLEYLTLDRDSETLSGGEAQRLRLARSLGSPLTGVTYILDEPTIGLHPQDHALLMETLYRLRDSGNTVIVVEHDEETIRAADYILDIGPIGGTRGGHVVASGNINDIQNNSSSITGTALKKREIKSKATIEKKRVAKSRGEDKSLTVTGASANNLKNITASFPLEKLSVVAGVSGAGKSSLIHDSLIPALLNSFGEDSERHPVPTWKTLSNDETLERFVEIDQTPVGKTSSSTPASYLGIFTDIRKRYAQCPEARTRGWSASRFSFNNKEGRCPTCSGLGFVKIPMSFLPEAHTPCEECNGLRYNEDTLEATFQGLSIGTLLQLTMEEAREVFSNHPRIKRPLDYVNQLGLGYISLGQATYTLSGGEAQRLKIAKELGARDAINTLYVLDEPTTGLHMNDVDRLIQVLKLLTQKGNTVIVIEHNLDVLAAADHIVEIGPGPGEAGGKIVFQGSPHQLLKSRSKTPTKPFLSLQPITPESNAHPLDCLHS